MKRPKKYEERPFWGMIADIRVIREKYLRVAMTAKMSYSTKMKLMVSASHLKLAVDSFVAARASAKNYEKEIF
jgi:hypothetical protein